MCSIGIFYRVSKGYFGNSFWIRQLAHYAGLNSVTKILFYKIVGGPMTVFTIRMTAYSESLQLQLEVERRKDLDHLFFTDPKFKVQVVVMYCWYLRIPNPKSYQPSTWKRFTNTFPFCLSKWFVPTALRVPVLVQRIPSASATSSCWSHFLHTYRSS